MPHHRTYREVGQQPAKHRGSPLSQRQTSLLARLALGMTLDLEGTRPRFFHERARIDELQGNPLHRNVTSEARQRLVRELQSLAYTLGINGPRQSILPIIEADVRRILGNDYTVSEYQVVEWGWPAFLSFLEISAGNLYFYRRLLSDIHALQSILRDDFSSFRFRDVGTSLDLKDKFQLQLIDNEHLHREVTDRTFELTRVADLESAQRDYAEAWKHYAKGDLDDALVNAHKAFESAAKVIIKRVDPASTPENMQTNRLVPELVRLEIIPGNGFATLVDNLRMLFQNAGTLRNQAGTGHGSIDLAGPEASIALMGLRLAGTFIAFFAERWAQLQPRA
jgi:hypothetical protein